MVVSSTSRRIVLICSILAFLATSLNFARAGLISASTVAEVNHLAGPFTQTSNSSTPGNITSIASAGGASANATVFWGDAHNLGVIAASNQAGLSNGASGDASLTEHFVVFGNSLNIIVPLTFNFTLQGFSSVSSGKDGAAVAMVSYHLQTPDMKSNGFATLQSQFGVASSSVGGGFGDASIQQVGTTEQFQFSAPLSITTLVQQSSLISEDLSAFASASTQASTAFAEYLDPLTLVSVSVPADFVIPASDLKVVFDDGLVMQVVSVPEPPSLTFALAAVVFFGFKYCRRTPFLSAFTNR